MCDFIIHSTTPPNLAYEAFEKVYKQEVVSSLELAKIESWQNRELAK